jgi:hypothetical protein
VTNRTAPVRLSEGSFLSRRVYSAWSPSLNSPRQALSTLPSGMTITAPTSGLLLSDLSSPTESRIALTASSMNSLGLVIWLSVSILHHST